MRKNLVRIKTHKFFKGVFCFLIEQKEGEQAFEKNDRRG